MTTALTMANIHHFQRITELLKPIETSMCYHWITVGKIATETVDVTLDVARARMVTMVRLARK